VKTIGLIGGLSWHSSLEYYRIINETVQARLGGGHSARCVMVSVDYEEIDALERQNRWDETIPIITAAAHSVERAGADFLVICSNTTHKLADHVQAQIGIPLLHIADATARAIGARGLTRVGLLGTRFTMEEDFIKGRMIAQGLDVMIPAAADRDVVHSVIYDELCLGQFRADSRAQYITVIERLVSAGALGIILGCTEIGLLVHPDDCPVPVFDTARIHAETAAAYAVTETTDHAVG
jgi:aspartate racemase